MKILPALLLSLLASCSNSGGDDDHVCTADLKTGVIVTLSDATTGAPIDGATLVLTAGRYQETMQQVANVPDAVYMGATTRPDTYDLSISAAGYNPDSRSEIEVLERHCEMLIMRFDIALTPAPPNAPTATCDRVSTMAKRPSSRP